jgi:hypothetical protein
MKYPALFVSFPARKGERKHLLIQIEISTLPIDVKHAHRFLLTVPWRFASACS